MNNQELDNKSGFFSVADIGIQIGDVRCLLRFNNAGLHESGLHKKIKELYSGFLTDEPPDITIELENTEHKNFAGPVEDSLIISNLYKNGIIRMPDSIITNHREVSSISFDTSGENRPIEPSLEPSNLNQLLLLSYYSACRRKYGGRPPAMLVHACGILRRGRVILFAGPSGGGKSTVASLCGHDDGEVINDEMVLISLPGPDDEGLRVQNVPIIGDFPPQRNVAAYLNCVFLLEKSEKTTVRRLGRTDAYLQFIRQVITPVYIGQDNMRESLALMADLSNGVTGNVPVYELEFTLDRESLWKAIAEFDKTPAKN